MAHRAADIRLILASQMPIFACTGFAARARITSNTDRKEQTTVDIINRDECPPFETKDGSIIREIMAYRNSDCEQVSLAEATVLPGQETIPHRHDRSEEIYYFLSGSGRMVLGEDRETVAPRDAVYIPPGTKHFVVNTEEEDLVFLCICCPPYEDEDTIPAEQQ